jgi:hypothetical protein
MAVARLLLTSALLATAAMPVTADDPAAIEFFERKIRPVLSEHCYECHSAEAAKAGTLGGKLALDSRAGIRQGGESGAAVVPGDVATSVLIKALRHEGLEMPPAGKLPDDVVADFVAWVQSGAADPRDGAPVATMAIDIEEGRSFWSFVPPTAQPRPVVHDAGWPLREHDWFIRAAHEARGLVPVAPATREEWLRRVSFDLVGLPPTPEELAAFLTDASSEAFATVVDRLLASTHFGERWARHWLDVARYTNDFGGTASVVPTPHAYRYRDWVVQAFNADMPYDRFVRLQLAGDLIADAPADYAERLAGLGFQGLGQRFSGNAVGMEKKKVADELDDRVDTLTRGLLGLTVSCARCHDHKFDPVPTHDYYALAAAYNGASWSAEIPLVPPAVEAAWQEWSKQSAAFADRIKKVLDAEIDRVGRAQVLRLQAYLLAAWRARALAAHGSPVDLPALARRFELEPVFLERLVNDWNAGKPPPDPPDLDLQAWRTAADAALPMAVVSAGDAEPPAAVVAGAARAATAAATALADLERFECAKRDGVPQPTALLGTTEAILKPLFQNADAVFRLKPEEVPPLLAAAARQEHEALTREQAEHAKTAPPQPPRAMGVTGGGTPMQIHIRGNADQLGAAVAPGFLQVLARPAVAAPVATGAATTFTRLDLAEAIVSRDNPLTARVYVNRVWHHLFARGIVGTPSNFGQLGDRPTHPALLDTLAVRFMENGWSTKWLVREIVLSATYRLSSRPDAGNQRIDGDNLLLWRVTPRRLEFEAWRDAALAVSGRLDRTPGGPPLLADGTAELHPENPAHGRRTLYCFVSRFKPNPTLTLFDVPEPNVTSEKRTVTTIPQQQLFALNSPFLVAMGKAFSERLLREADSDDARIDRGWRLAFARGPTPEERQAALDYLAATGGDWPQFCHALLMSNEFMFLP